MNRVLARIAVGSGLWFYCIPRALGLLPWKRHPRKACHDDCSGRYQRGQKHCHPPLYSAYIFFTPKGKVQSGPKDGPGQSGIKEHSAVTGRRRVNHKPFLLEVYPQRRQNANHQYRHRRCDEYRGHLARCFD